MKVRSFFPRLFLPVYSLALSPDFYLLFSHSYYFLSFDFPLFFPSLLLVLFHVVFLMHDSSPQARHLTLSSSWSYASPCLVITIVSFFLYTLPCPAPQLVFLIFSSLTLASPCLSPRLLFSLLFFSSLAPPLDLFMSFSYFPYPNLLLFALRLPRPHPAFLLFISLTPRPAPPLTFHCFHH